MSHTGDSLVAIENLIEQYQPEFSSVNSEEIKTFLERLQSVVASNNTLTLKTIHDLLPLHFFVSDYQRGYKWQTQQVEELLNDIHEFEPVGKGFYCLQPIVVKHHCAKNIGDKGQWELIDGQQRMTTIFMILSYLECSHYSIDYQTRASSSEFLLKYLPSTLICNNWDDFLKLAKLDSAKLDNVDNYHFYSSYKTIHSWFTDEKRFSDSDARKKWLEKLLYNTKVIWYAARGNEQSVDRRQSIDIFMRINSGKIPLTNAELIKALLLSGIADSQQKELSDLKQSEMSQQWDAIEQGLQNNEFWAFLSPPEYANNQTTRIELLFDLISEKPTKLNVQSVDEYFAFNYYYQKLKLSENKKHHKVETLWHEVKQSYYRLREWFENDELYHLVGFLINRNISNIQKLWILAEHKQKSEFIISLKQLISSQLRKYFKSDNNVGLDFNQVQYETKNRRKIISILILLNIHVHRANKTRLSFKTYREISWDIEHIHAQQSKKLNEKLEADIWHSEQSALLNGNHIPKVISDTLKKLLALWYEANKEEHPNIEKLQKDYIEELVKVIGDIENDEIHALDNLCLLSGAVNRGIGNEVFPAKRKMIISYEKEHHFIPIATKNVFSKVYSDNVSQMYKWSKEDREGYRKEIIDCCNFYISKGELV